MTLFFKKQNVCLHAWFNDWDGRPFLRAINPELKTMGEDKEDDIGSDVLDPIQKCIISKW